MLGNFILIGFLNILIVIYILVLTGSKNFFFGKNDIPLSTLEEIKRIQSEEMVLVFPKFFK